MKRRGTTVRVGYVLRAVLLASTLSACGVPELPGPVDAGPQGQEPELPAQGRPDAGTPHQGEVDAGAPDAGSEDGGVTDAGTPDAGTPDAGTPDAGVVGCPSLRLERSVAVDGFLSDRYSWRDGACLPRSAAMVHNDVMDPTGQWGGYLRRYTYEVEGATRVCDGALTSHPGWGYTVNHYENTSKDSKQFPGTFRTVLEGRHHALLEYRWRLDLGGRPVLATVQWFFATGKDHPVWAVTFDTSLLAPNTIRADSRSPYGDLLFDGNANAEIAGVSWGDRHRFVTLHSPLTMSSGWDYTAPNLVPFVRSWTKSPDAEMGSVQTQTWRQHDAGGGWLYGSWDKSYPGGPMPQDWNWTYQLNQYQLAQSTRSHRLAWGTNYGAVGATEYEVYGADRKVSGYPYQSYSVFMVLGRHSTNTVLGQVGQVESFQDVRMTASVGQVLTQGPAGIARTDTVLYEPVGYNPILATWEVRADANRARFDFTTGARPVDSPVFVIRGYTASAPPARVSLGGVTLVPDVDYFASLDDAGDAVWLTLARSLTGTATLSLE